MRIPHRPGLIAFALTTAILVPAGLSLLEAGPGEVARLVRPGLGTVDIDGATVKVSADRGIIDAGGNVHLSLTATAERAHAVRVAVLLEESRGSDGGRVPDPPATLAEDTVDLSAAPGGGKARELVYKLRGYQGTSMMGRDAYGSYTILVMAPRDAAAFERKHEGAIDGRNNDFWTEYEGLGESGKAARVAVATRRVDPDLKIEIPSGVQVGQPFTVSIVLGKKVQHPEAVVLDLHTPDLGADYIGIDDGSVTIDGGSEKPLGKGERRLEMKVTVNVPGLLGLEATARNDETGQIFATALDAIDVQPAIPGLAEAALQR